MSEINVTADELLAGAGATFDIVVPPGLLNPGNNNSNANGQDKERMIRLRPLTIGKFQLIMKASRNERELIPLLMVRESVVEPELSLEQVKKMHLGLIEFLISQIRSISGLAEKKNL